MAECHVHLRRIGWRTTVIPLLTLRLFPLLSFRGRREHLRDPQWRPHPPGQYPSQREGPVVQRADVADNLEHKARIRHGGDGGHIAGEDCTRGEDAGPRPVEAAPVRDDRGGGVEDNATATDGRGRRGRLALGHKPASRSVAAGLVSSEGAGADATDAGGKRRDADGGDGASHWLFGTSVPPSLAESAPEAKTGPKTSEGAHDRRDVDKDEGEGRGGRGAGSRERTRGG